MRRGAGFVNNEPVELHRSSRDPGNQEWPDVKSPNDPLIF